MIYYPNCKINLGLNILNRRPDGFHNLETVFYPVPLTDVLEITPNSDVNAQGITFSTSGIDIPDDGDNLCIRAFELVRADFSLPATLIHLHKCIPMGAGLGGGSADAASTLKGLNEVYELGISVADLENYARQLGSDCAFFVKNEPVFATQKGDCFHPTRVDLSGWNLVLVNPNIHVSTAEAYACVDKNPAGRALRRSIEQPVQEWKNQVFNDFEGSVFPLHPDIDVLKDRLYAAGAVYAAMSGSGSTCFGLFEKEVDLSSFSEYFVWQGVL